MIELFSPFRKERITVPKGIPDHWVGGALDRAVIAAHYAACEARGETLADIEDVRKVELRIGRGLALVATGAPRAFRGDGVGTGDGRRGLQRADLYYYWKSERGYQLRRLYPDADGADVVRAYVAAKLQSPKSLAAIGLSYRELEALTGLDRLGVEKAIRAEERSGRKTA